MKFVNKEIIEIEHTITIEDESGFLVDGSLDGYDMDEFGEYEEEDIREEIKNFVDEFDIKSGSIEYDNRNLILDVVLNNNVKIYLHEKGEYDMWGGPYTPKMRMVELKKDGIDILEKFVNNCKQIDPENNIPINYWIREYGWEKLLK